MNEVSDKVGQVFMMWRDRAQAAEAAIERVRAVCEGDKTAKDVYDLAADVLIALDAPKAS